MSNPTEHSWSAWGARLRAAREAAGLTQVQLAERSGRSQATVSQVESGVRARPDTDTQVAFATALGVPVTDLFPRDEAEADLVVRCSGAH